MEEDTEAIQEVVHAIGLALDGHAVSAELREALEKTARSWAEAWDLPAHGAQVIPLRAVGPRRPP